MAASTVVVTVEELCDTLQPVPNGIVIPSWIVSSIVHAPGGARPSYVQGFYGRDDTFYRMWDDISRDRDRFLQWMEENVLECVPA